VEKDAIEYLIGPERHLDQSVSFESEQREMVDRRRRRNRCVNRNGAADVPGVPNTSDQQTFSSSVSRMGAPYTLAAVAGGRYLGALAHRDRLRQAGLLETEALLDGLIVSETIKMAAHRDRPLEGDHGGHFFRSGYSFPSGHAVENFALASVIAHRYPAHKALGILSDSLAALVGASRFSPRQHFASDIVWGGAIGYFIGKHVVESHQSPKAGRARVALSSGDPDFSALGPYLRHFTSLASWSK
jgi:hypothetical protein